MPVNYPQRILTKNCFFKFSLLLVVVLGIFLTALLIFGVNWSGAEEPPLAVQPVTQLKVDEVWVGTRIRFDAISVGNIVYVGYYDAARQLTVARIDTLSGTIKKRTLGSEFAGWDSHNYIVLTYDRFGYLHVAGNMHASRLVYARMVEKDNFDSLTRVSRMVGTEEESVTYPKFFNFQNGDLGLTYRSGTSGDGVELINRFDGSSWSRHSKLPVFSASVKGPRVNAYHTGYSIGPDGYFHIAWVWRLSPMVESNFNVNYARSKDLEHWYDSQGHEVALPLTPSSADVADRIAPGSGLYNNIKLGFDGYNVPIVSYLKYDESGYTQLYHARPSEKGWQVSRMTNWHFRLEITGTGTKVMPISFSGVRVRDGVVTESVQHPEAGSLVFSYGKDALKVEQAERSTQSRRCGNTKPWIQVSQDINNTSGESYRGRLIWRSLANDNNDRPRSCSSIGLAEGCRMTATLFIVSSSSPMACAP